MPINLGRYGSRNILNLQMFDYSSKSPLMYMDYATSAENSWTGDVVYARGGDGNPRRIAFPGDKESTVTIETQIFTMQHLAMLAGESITKGSKEIFKTQVVTVEDDGSGGKKVALAKTPYGNIGNVSVFAFVNGIIGEPQQVSTISNNDLILDPTSTVKVGEDVEVYYQTTVADAATLRFTAKGFPGYVKLVGDTLYADEISGEMVSAQLTYFKARLQPNFTINMSPTGDPATLSLVFDVFPAKIDGVDTLSEMVIYQD